MRAACMYVVGRYPCLTISYIQQLTVDREKPELMEVVCFLRHEVPRQAEDLPLHIADPQSMGVPTGVSSRYYCWIAAAAAVRAAYPGFSSPLI